ncbi:LOW QUALITY PROTEIN: hypothetical protein KUTeg_018497 [Tegillarca granosa]|uniref:Uncharacterized protein n=1 Tax=Tegillarca granosa TaxID=220873 RepID=A0ABQ9EI11_TEGGR|nr:LOW QUALITY PROTEIN: hypothetical protein KUTeg_018497 [Tegillarca granosa]
MSGITNAHPLSGYTARHLLDSRSENTVKKYYYSFKKRVQFICAHNFVAIPAAPIHVVI